MPLARITVAFATLVLALAPAAARAAHRPNPHAELDCAYCHGETPRFGVDTRETVTFWRAEGDEPWLCERCHAPEENIHPLFVAPGPGRLAPLAPEHLPLGQTEQVRGVVVCTTCHFLHAADADHALLRGFRGATFPGPAPVLARWQDFCRECHGDQLEKRSPHAGDERSCAFCHSVVPEPGKPAAVTPAAGKLCAFCHGVVREMHFSGIVPGPATDDCTACHDPHLGKDYPARLKEGFYGPIRNAPTINPHGRRSTCFACHGDAAGKTLREPDVVATCQRCHASGEITGMSHPMHEVPPGYEIPAGWPLAGGALTCVTCHLPGHVGDGGRNLLRHQGERETDVCFRCHRRPEATPLNPHAMVAKSKTGCETCHADRPVYGKDRRDTVTFKAGINIVCLACHDPGPHPGGVRHTRILPPDSKSVPESFPLAEGRYITCATCHNPHIAPGEGANLRGLREPQAFCTRCHTFR